MELLETKWLREQKFIVSQFWKLGQDQIAAWSAVLFLGMLPLLGCTRSLLPASLSSFPSVHTFLWYA